MNSKPIEVFFFRNGNTAVCGPEQIPELQRPWFLLFVEFLESKGVDLTGARFYLPDGYSQAVLFKTESGYNWQIEPSPPLTVWADKVKPDP